MFRGDGEGGRKDGQGMGRVGLFEEEQGQVSMRQGEVWNRWVKGGPSGDRRLGQAIKVR